MLQLIRSTPRYDEVPEAEKRLRDSLTVQQRRSKSRFIHSRGRLRAALIATDRDHIFSRAASCSALRRYIEIVSLDFTLGPPTRTDSLPISILRFSRDDTPTHPSPRENLSVRFIGFHLARNYQTIRHSVDLFRAAWRRTLH